MNADICSQLLDQQFTLKMDYRDETHMKFLPLCLPCLLMNLDKEYK